MRQPQFKLRQFFCFQKTYSWGKFYRKPVEDVLSIIFTEKSGTIVGRRTIINVSTELLNRTKDCQSIWGLKTAWWNLVEALLLILIAADMFVYEFNLSTGGNEVILNFKWNYSKKLCNIHDDNSWKVITEQYFRYIRECS